jgi:hypothetical protein
MHHKSTLRSHRTTQTPLWNIATACVLSLFLSGCGLIQQASGIIIPKREAKLLIIPDLTLNPEQGVLNYYGNSFSECLSFKEQLLSESMGINAGSDYATLILSALATVIAPIGTVHLLTAGAMATTGLKTTFTNDVTTDNSANLTIALDKIYFQPMAKLAETTLSSAITSDTAPGMVAQIINLQEQCSLDEARAYISQNLSHAAPQKPTGEALSPDAVVAGRRPNPGRGS